MNVEARRRRRRSCPCRRRPGEPSVFKHVVYIIKENRTYDQVFGDLPQGNGDPEPSAVFGREVTPNHHALAEQFVLLDNFYCNGVLSADGHSVDQRGLRDGLHFEKSFGGFTRSYPYGATTRWPSRRRASSGTTSCARVSPSATTASSSRQSRAQGRHLGRHVSADYPERDTRERQAPRPNPPSTPSSPTPAWTVHRIPDAPCRTSTAPGSS
jgi:hypothetical protein